MTFTLIATMAGALFTGLLALFWGTRIVMLALGKFRASNMGGLTLLFATTVMAIACFIMTTNALSLAGLI